MKKRLNVIVSALYLRYTSLILLLFYVNAVIAQCTTSSLNINTGISYGQTSSVPIPLGGSDPEWQVINISAATRTAIGGGPATPMQAIVATASTWTANNTTSRWISFAQNTAYATTSPGGPYTMTLRRQFTMCSADQVNFNFSALRDNSINSIRINGVLVFSETPTSIAANYSGPMSPLALTTSTMSLPAGTYNIDVDINNHVVGHSANDHGFRLEGTITSAGGNPTIRQNSYTTCSCACDDICYWRVGGNNILNGNNTFGTRSNDHVRIITNNPGLNVTQDRGIITNNGLLGWNLNTTNLPTALFDVDCNGNNTQASGQSDIRFRSLETNGSNSLNLLGIDANGFVFNTGRPASTTNKWDLAGNTISAADFLGTINNEDIRFNTFSSGLNSQRMVIKGSYSGNQNDPMAGYVGINTPAPTARLHVDCVNGNGDPNGNPNSPAAALSDIRFQGLETTANPLTVLGIDANGYVYNTNRSLPPTTVQNSWNFVGNPAPSNSIFGITTVTGQDIKIHSDGAQRGVIDHNGNFGWNLGAGGLPTTYMHVNAAGVNAPPTGSGVRFENLQSKEGSIMVIDKDGYVYDSRLNINDMQGVKNNCGTTDMVPKFDASGNLTCSQIFDDPSGSGVGIGSTGPFTYSAGLYYNGTSNSGGTLALDVAGVTQSLEYVATSDRNYKSNISSIKNPFTIINNLQGKTYTWNDKAKAELKADNGKHYGFIAQEVAEVMPEAVVVNEKGRYGVNYNSMIPLLTEGQKELYKALEEEKSKNAELYNKLKELEGRINQLLITKSDITAVDKYNAQVQNELYQNSPNPFGKETSIGYNIVNMQQGAFIAVYDLNGKELFRQAVAEKGKGSVTVSGDKLVPGMYLYSLIVDGKETATKRMVVTK